MKLQAKFTINFVLLVVVTIAVSFFLINWSVQTQFTHFIDEKNQQWKSMYQHQNDNGNPPQNLNPGRQDAIVFNDKGVIVLPLQNPLDHDDRPQIGNPITPEQNYLRTLSGSLLWAGSIVMTFAVLLAYLLSRVLLRRIQHLQTAMHRYIQDGVSKPVLHEGKDEVDELANIYNLLIEKIEHEEKIRKDFFIDMSHELRTPLTSIKGYLEGLVDKVFDQDKEQMIHEKTLRETDRMIHLVKEMTMLAKLESEHAKLNLQPVDLRPLTDDVVEMISHQLDEKQLSIEVVGNAKTQVDEDKFRQVLINLLDNAVQYAPANSLIRVEMGDVDNKVFWRIANEFSGAPPQRVDHFFERFYRGDKSRSYDSKKPHLGIGLNIVQKIVEQHGAAIEARLESHKIIFEISLQS